MGKRTAMWALVTLALLAVVVGSVSFGLAQSGTEYAVELVSWSVSDDGPDPPAANNPEGKNVAWCSGELQDRAGGDGLMDHFEFAIHNGYPGYECQVTLVVMNAGDNPFDIVGVGVNSVGTADVTAIVYEPAALPVPLAAGATVDVVFTVYVGEGATPDTIYDIEGSIDVEGE